MLSELWRPSLIFAALPFVVYIGQNCLHRVHVYLEELGLKEEMNFVNQALDLFVEFDHVTDEDLVLLEGVLVNVGKRVESLMTSEVMHTQTVGYNLYLELRLLHRRAKDLDQRLLEILMDIPKKRNSRPINRF